MNDEPSELAELETAIAALVDRLRLQDRETYYQSIQLARFMELFFNGIQALFFDSQLGDFRTIDTTIKAAFPNVTGGSSDYRKVINLIRGHIESIISALTAVIPGTRFGPKNPEDEVDVTTAKASESTAKYIATHNDVKTLFARAVYVLFTQGPVAVYNYSKRDKAFGLITDTSYQLGESTVNDSFCPMCGTPLSIGEETPEPFQFCSSCEQLVEPHVEQETIPTAQQIDVIYPDAREIIEVYGVKNVRFPMTAAGQDEIGYIMLSGEYDEAQLEFFYPGKLFSPARGDEFEGRRAREPLTGLTRFSQLVTVDRVWLRPWEYNLLTDELKAQAMQYFPDGMYVVLNGSTVLDMRPESLDEHWTLIVNPLSERLYFYPLALSAVPIQRLINKLINQIIETVDQGVPVNFVDPDVLDLDEWEQSEAEVGAWYNVKSRIRDKDLSAGFHQTRSTNLPTEVYKFLDQLQDLLQFVLGSFPSIYGGPGSGSGTLGEYERSRVQALQRLDLPLSWIRSMWAKVMRKSVFEFIKEIRQDIAIPQAQGDSYAAIWIKQADLLGKTTDTITETDAAFPTTIAELSARITQWLETNNPIMTQLLTDPQNISRTANLLGLDGFYIPGENQRNAELDEIRQLLMSPPGPDGMPTILPDPNVDDHQLRVSTLQSWAVSPFGMNAKVNNPDGYANVMAHLMIHNQYLAMMQQQAVEPDKREVT